MLEDVRQNIAKLIALYEAEKSRADELADRLEKSEASLKSYQEQITDLNGQIDNLKLMSAFTASGDTVAAKERITSLIKEIDRCIRLLEK